MKGVCFSCFDEEVLHNYLLLRQIMTVIQLLDNTYNYGAIDIPSVCEPVKCGSYFVFTVSFC